LLDLGSGGVKKHRIRIRNTGGTYGIARSVMEPEPQHFDVVKVRHFCRGFGSSKENSNKILQKTLKFLLFKFFALKAF
jgi:hypothetical protein